MSAGSCLTLPTDLHEQILGHAWESRPKEAVGLLGGRPGGEVTLALPLPNVAAGNKRFIADPFAQFCAFRRLASEGLELLAIYHSHPGGGLDPSADDLEHAKHWSCVHVIVAVGTHGRSFQNLRAFRCVEMGSIEDVAIEVAPG